MHRRVYLGPIEIVVSQGDILYISDVEKACTQEPFRTNDVPVVTADDETHPIEGSGDTRSINEEKEVVESREMSGPTDDSNAAGSVTGECNSATNGVVGSVDRTQRSGPNGSEAAMVRRVEEQMNALLRLRAKNVYRDHRNRTAQPHPLSATGNNGDGGPETVPSVTSSTLHPPDDFFDPLLHPPPPQSLPWHCALVVCVPLRLGEHHITPEYIEVRIFL